MTNQVPSHDPTIEGSLPGTLMALLKKYMQGMDDMLPAMVISFDRATNVAEVQPLISLVLTDGSTISRSPVSTVQMLQLGGGGFVFSLPIKPGNLGWIKASDRDISLFAQSLAESPPNTGRMHNFSDSLFIPDVMKNYTINAEDEDSAVLQTVDGSVRISIGTSRIKMTAPTVEIDGDISATGSMNIAGQITSDTGVNVGPIELGDHGHSGVQPGGGITQGPVPL